MTRITMKLITRLLIAAALIALLIWTLGAIDYYGTKRHERAAQTGKLQRLTPPHHTKFKVVFTIEYDSITIQQVAIIDWSLFSVCKGADITVEISNIIPATGSKGYGWEMMPDGSLHLILPEGYQESDSLAVPPSDTLGTLMSPNTKTIGLAEIEI